MGSARAFDPGSTNGGAYAIGIFYSGYVVATTPHATPLYVDLGFVASDPLNQVDVYICSYAWHGNPLVSVQQSAGYFDQSTAGKFVSVPNPGVTNMDMYLNTLTSYDRNVNNLNADLSL